MARTKPQEVGGLPEWLQDGRVCVFLLLIPLAAMAPWLYFTSPAAGVVGKATIGIELFRFSGLTPEIANAEYANRLNVMAAASLLVLVGLAATAFAALVTFRSATQKADRLAHFGVWAVVFAICAWLVVFSDGRIYDHLGTGLFAGTLGTTANGQPLLSLLHHKLDVVNFTVTLAATMLAIAAASIATAASRIASIAQLARHDRLSRRLDAILLASATVLAAGLIEIKQWYGWPLPYIDQGDRNAFTSICNAFVGLQSVSYVGVLAGIYFPAGLVLDHARSRMALDLKYASGRHSEVETTQASALLVPRATGRVEQLVRGIAILSPIMVGPLASFFGLKLG